MLPFDFDSIEKIFFASSSGSLNSSLEYTKEARHFASLTRENNNIYTSSKISMDRSKVMIYICLILSPSKALLKQNIRILFYYPNYFLQRLLQNSPPFPFTFSFILLVYELVASMYLISQLVFV